MFAFHFANFTFSYFYAWDSTAPGWSDSGWWLRPIFSILQKITLEPPKTHHLEYIDWHLYWVCISCARAPTNLYRLCLTLLYSQYILYTVYTSYTVYTVYTLYTVYTVYTLYTLYTLYTPYTLCTVYIVYTLYIAYRIHCMCMCKKNLNKYLTPPVVLLCKCM